MNVLELVQGMEKGGRTQRILDTATGLDSMGWNVRILPMVAPSTRVVESYTGGAEWASLEKRQGR